MFWTFAILWKYITTFFNSLFITVWGPRAFYVFDYWLYGLHRRHHWIVVPCATLRCTTVIDSSAERTGRARVSSYRFPCPPTGQLDKKYRNILAEDPTWFIYTRSDEKNSAVICIIDTSSMHGDVSPYILYMHLSGCRVTPQFWKDWNCTTKYLAPFDRIFGEFVHQSSEVECKTLLHLPMLSNQSLTYGHIF